jgi:glycosyltransferase involved in cell wall biosynthesis
MGGPIRVLHVVVNMNRGGAETLLMNLYRNIDRTKVQFDFLTCKEGVFDKEIKLLGGKVHRIPYVTEKGHFGFTKALNSFFKGHPEYKIVHSHMDKMSGIILESARRCGVPARIAHSHNTHSEGGTAAKLYKWYAGRKITASATHMLACSNAAADWLFEKKVDSAKILKNGIDCSKFSYSPDIRKRVRESLKLKNNFVIGHVGRFNEQKNHYFLIDLFYEITKHVPAAKLVLAGDGPLRKEIEKKVCDLELDHRVHFLGVREDIHHLVQGMDVFLFPSLHEGLPVTLIEAQGSGLPCIISDTITEEVDMGINLVDFCPLDEIHPWLEAVKAISQTASPRRISSETLAEKGYDIKASAQWSEGFYSAI